MGSKCSLPQLCVWQYTGSLALLLQAQEHHFSPDELSGVITVPQRSVTRIKAALPHLASTESCLCSPVLSANEKLYPTAQTHYSLPTLFGPFHFYSIPLWFDLIIMGLKMDCFFAIFVIADIFLSTVSTFSCHQVSTVQAVKARLMIH